MDTLTYTATASAPTSTGGASSAPPPDSGVTSGEETSGGGALESSSFTAELDKNRRLMQEIGMEGQTDDSWQVVDEDFEEAPQMTDDGSTTEDEQQHSEQSEEVDLDELLAKLPESELQKLADYNRLQTELDQIKGQQDTEARNKAISEGRLFEFESPEIQGVWVSEIFPKVKGAIDRIPKLTNELVANGLVDKINALVESGQMSDASLAQTFHDFSQHMAKEIQAAIAETTGRSVHHAMTQLEKQMQSKQDRSQFAAGVEQKWHGALSEIAEELSAKGRPLTQEEATEATGILNKLIGSGVFSEDEAIQISAKQFTNGARAGAEAERKAVVQRANGRAAANGAAGGSRSGITNAVKISDFLGKPGGMEKIEQYQKRGIL